MNISPSMAARFLRASFFPPDSERLLNRTIGEAEEDRFVLSLMCDLVPGGGDEDVVLVPVESRIADLRTAAPFDDAIHRRVRGTVSRAAKP